jgi:hypothetical protein
MARLKLRWTAACRARRGVVLTSVAEQLDDHLGRQRILAVSDEEPGGGLVHATLHEPCLQLVV